MTADWKELENRVRELASNLWNRTAAPEHIAGVDLDCVLKLEAGHWILVEVSKSDTLEKLRTDLAKFSVVRPFLMSQGIASRCFFVTEHSPPPSLIETGNSSNVEVMSASDFSAQFFDFQSYRVERLQRQFGSAVDPETGKIDTAAYIPVRYHRKSGQEIDIKEIANLLAIGKKVVLLGEFGTGKSRAFGEIFGRLSEYVKDLHRYPIAINLRDNWGLKRGTEIIRRHFDDLGLGHLADNVVKVFQRQSILFLLDGFDEIGSQTWSDDPRRLVAIREQSLHGVKDLLAKTAGGAIVSGRTHYFNSEPEMLTALGLDPHEVEIISCQSEFTLQEMTEYLSARGKSLTLPSWLPRRPLICQTIAKLPDVDIDRLSHAEGDAAFCISLIEIICKREALINASLDAKRVQDILRILARLTRSKPNNFGPLSVPEINKAFETIIGIHPVDESAVMLQRLPGLGRLTAESSDREFVDEYLLEGLRALDVMHATKTGEEGITQEAWINPLRDLGYTIVASWIDEKSHEKSQDTAPLNWSISLMRKAAQRKNRVLAGDIVASILHCDTLGESFGFSGLALAESQIFHLDLSNLLPADLTISHSLVEKLTLPILEATNVKVVDCKIGTALQVSGATGLPPWVERCEVASFQSVSTVAQIKEASLDPPHLILVTVIKKTFFQKGNGRKEEALLRGLGTGANAKVSQRILKLLITESILKKIAGDEGAVYVPVRSQTQRMRALITELSLSKDPLWLAVAKYA